MGLSIFIGHFLLATGSISIAFVLYTIQRNYRPAFNRVFLGMGIAMLIWCTGSSILINGARPEIAALGTRLAAVGYSSLFAMVLHYVLLLTESRWLSRRCSLLLLYLPSFVSIVGLTILPILGVYSETFINTPAGWDDVTKNGWVTYYYLYYIAYALISMGLLWRWQMKAREPRLRNQASALLLSMPASIALGTIVDMLLSLRGLSFPNLSALFAVIPMVAISYSVKWYGFMQPEMVNPNEVILDHKTRADVYRIAARCFVIGSFLSIFIQILLHRLADPYSIAAFSGTLFTIGFAMLRLSRSRVNENFKELLFAVLFSILIPMITLRFVIYSSITIWPNYIMLLLISLLFNQRVLMTVSLLSAFQTQLMVWSISPEINVTIDSMDHFVRLMLLAVVASIGLYVSRIYRHRLRANAVHTSRQAMVADIVQSLVTVDEHNFEHKMQAILSNCGSFLQCERATLTLWGSGAPEDMRSFEWVQEDATPRGSGWCPNLLLLYPQLLERSARNAIIVVSDRTILPESAYGIRDYLIQRDIRSAIFLPIVRNDEVVGLLSFGTSKTDMDWVESPPAFLSIIANTISDALAKLEDTRRLEWAAYHDILTRLPNRQLFNERLRDAVQRAKRDGAILGVAFIDLDAFKTINDTMGHETGDLLLREVASVLSACTGQKNTVARFGGDEFVVLIEDVSREEAIVGITQDMLRAIQKPVMLRGQELYIGGSIGVSVYPNDGDDPETLLKNADIAMYEAKRLGRNQYALCTQHMRNKAIENTRLINLLYRALEKGQLAVYYQPQVSLVDGSISGLEALLRWNLPGQGFVSPAVFIPLAEQTGLIQPIGAWVLETACLQNKRWQEMGFPAARIAVNISVHQLENRDFVKQIADVLLKTGLPPECLELEITESTSNSKAVNMVALMSSLKALGVSISIDDFGTEYSSLERLKQLPIDRIKIDMQFIRGIETSDKDRAIAQVIINLAKSLDMKVIAEGVETETQLSFLSHRMCDEVQGYYYYKPMTAEHVEAVFLESAKRGVCILAELECALVGGGIRI